MGTTTYELGVLPVVGRNTTDWVAIKRAAIEGDLLSEAIPADVFVRCYNALSRIKKDFMSAVAVERTVYVFWGATGTGKSRDAWGAAGLDAYPKDPNTKFWDGYRNQESVVMDEFRGIINISNLLRWCDRYPVIVECKGSSCTFTATTIWITSNLDPRLWYPDCDSETVSALLRRLNITHYQYYICIAQRRPVGR